MKAVNIHAAKTHLSRLVDEAAAGADIVIAKAGRPMVRLVPVARGQRRAGFGALKGKIRMRASFDAPLPAALARALGLRP
ncbi:MAG: type II toxin-antitoxin system Phd/YefM family antitoxin [Vicinamibacterales bacterium]